MSFKEKGSVTFKTVDGKLKEEVESETIITLTNKITKQEYGSDTEAAAGTSYTSWLAVVTLIRIGIIL